MFIAAAAVFVFSFSFSQTQWHVSVNTVVLESSSSSSFQAFVFFVWSSMLSFFESHACWQVPVNIFELVSAASFAGASVGLLVSLCCCLHLTARSLTFFPSF